MVSSTSMSKVSQEFLRCLHRKTMVPTKVYWCYIVLQSTLSTLKAISLHIENICLYGGFPTMVATQQLLVFLLKMTILGVLGVPPFQETPIYFLFMYIHVYTVYMYIDS